MAKKIAALGDGIAGFGEYSAGNTGGWHFHRADVQLGRRRRERRRPRSTTTSAGR